MSIKERRKKLLAARETLLENMAIEYGDFRVYCSWFKDGEYSKEGCAKKLNDYIRTRNKLKAIDMELESLNNNPKGRTRKSKQ